MPTLTNNNNIPGVHFPGWEQMPSIMPANSAAGSCMVSDNKRYIYYLISSSAFHRIDTWTGVVDQLAYAPIAATGAGTCMCYVPEILGSEFYTEGKIFALTTNGTNAPIFRAYSINGNVWTNLSVANLPSTFGTDGSLFYPSPSFNNLNSFHSSAINTITVTQDINVGTGLTVTVNPLPKALPSKALLNFGTVNSPKYVSVVNAAVSGATSIYINSFSTISANSIAYYYDHIYLIGNNSTQIYRYQISTNTWSTTSANNSNPVLPTISGKTFGAGCNIFWVPGSSSLTYNSTIYNSPDTLILFRGTGSYEFFTFNLSDNTLKNLYLLDINSDTYTTGSQYCTRIINNKYSQAIINQNITNKFHRLNLENIMAIKEPIAYQDLITPGTALVGNRTCIINQSGVDFLYTIPSTSNVMLRHPISL